MALDQTCNAKSLNYPSSMVKYKPLLDGGEVWDFPNNRGERALGLCQTSGEGTGNYSWDCCFLADVDVYLCFCHLSNQDILRMQELSFQNYKPKRSKMDRKLPKCNQDNWAHKPEKGERWKSKWRRKCMHTPKIINHEVLISRFVASNGLLKV